MLGKEERNSNSPFPTCLAIKLAPRGSKPVSTSGLRISRWGYRRIDDKLPDSV